MIGLTFRIGGKAWGFFVVKRATSHKIKARFFQGDVRVDEVNNINTNQQVSYKFTGNKTCHVLQVKAYVFNAALIFWLTTDISARPCILGLSCPITFPISFIDVAEVVAIASFMNVLISSSVKAWGKKS